MRFLRISATLFSGAMLLAGASAAAEAAVLINVDKSAQQMTVSVDGAERYTWPVSTGRSGYSTPSGNFTAFRMEEDHRSKEWDDAPMPHSIFFTQEGHAIHGSLETRKLGTPASHGCVRISPANATTLFNLVKAEGLLKTKVVITGSEPEPAVAKRDAPAKKRKPVRAAPDDEGDDPAAADVATSRQLDGYAARMRQQYREEQVVRAPAYAAPTYAYDDRVARAPAYAEPRYAPRYVEPRYEPRYNVRGDGYRSAWD